MVESTTYIIAAVGVFTVIGAITATWYHWKRIAIEKRRSDSMKAFYEAQLTVMREQLQRTERYYDLRVEFVKEQLEVEKAKLAVEHEKVAIEKQKLAVRNGTHKLQIPERP